MVTLSAEEIATPAILFLNAGAGKYGGFAMTDLDHFLMNSA
jgi:hypothetical protein